MNNQLLKKQSTVNKSNLQQKEKTVKDRSIKKESKISFN